MDARRRRAAPGTSLAFSPTTSPPRTTRPAHLPAASRSLCLPAHPPPPPRWSPPPAAPHHDWLCATQGHEAAFLEAPLQFFASARVRAIHLRTYSKAGHEALRAAFSRQGWRVLQDMAGGLPEPTQTPFGPVRVPSQGILSLENVGWVGGWGARPSSAARGGGWGAGTAAARSEAHICPRPLPAKVCAWNPAVTAVCGLLGRGRPVPVAAHVLCRHLTTCAPAISAPWPLAGPLSPSTTHAVPPPAPRPPPPPLGLRGAGAGCSGIARSG